MSTDVNSETFKELAKQAGEELTKRILSDDFEYCMGYMAIIDYKGKCKLKIELTLTDVKILETGLEHFKKSLQESIDKQASGYQINENDESKNEVDKEFDEFAKCEQEECDKIKSKLRLAQIPIFKDLTEEEIRFMYNHQICGPGYWTSGGSI